MSVFLAMGLVGAVIWALRLWTELRVQERATSVTARSLLVVLRTALDHAQKTHDRSLWMHLKRLEDPAIQQSIATVEKAKAASERPASE